MDKQDLDRPWRAPAQMMDFEHLVPGWANKVAHPYNLPIEAGIRLDIARLQGARFLVCVLHREYDYEGLYEEIFLDAGFVDPLEAAQHAQRVLEGHAKAALDQHPDWHPLGGPSHLWPSREAVGAQLLRLPPQKLGDGTGFNSREIYVVVLPTEAERPLSAGLFQILDKTAELNAYFRRVGGG